ncbi:MAG: substrate-binding domain-containing protein [Desulfuromonadales bacterium]
MQDGMFVNKYAIQKEIATFDNGTVLYHASDIAEGRSYFIKVFKGGHNGDSAKLRDSFYAEAKNLAHLNHRNILQAIDFFEDEGGFYLVQEYFNSYRLDEIINHHGGSKELPTLHVIKQVLKALSFAHGRGVIHREVSSANVLVARNGEVKLDGFGASSHLLLEAGTSANLFAAASYMSPEQIVNPKAIDRRSDIYSVGMLMYKMLTGAPPREAGTTIIQLMRQMEEDIPDIRQKLPKLDQELAEIISRALSRSPDHRFQTCDEFIAALEHYQHRDQLARAEQEKIVEQKRRRRKFLLRGSSAAVMLAVLCWGAWYLFFAERIETVLKLQGSNTIGAKLAPALVEEFLKRKGAHKTRREPGAKEEEIRIIGSMGGTRAWAVDIKSHGSGTAFEGLEKSLCDIGMSSRPIKKEELDKLASQGDFSRYGSEHVIGLDWLAVIVNTVNTLSSASKDTIGAIFAGEMKSWKELGGADKAIALYARDDKSGTFDTFKSLVLDKKKLSGNAKRFEDSTLLSTEVANDSNGIGFIGLPYIKSSKALAITSSDAGGPIYPNSFTVAREEYPLSRRLFMYLPPKTANALSRDFVDFVLSDDGQEVLEKNGFVSLTVRSETPVLSASTTPEFRSLVEGAERLSLSFRFRPDTISFDNRSRRDFDRLIHALDRKELQGRKIMLFGFCDVSEGKKALEVSEQWTKLTSGELTARGIRPAVEKGMGAIMPLAQGGTKDGKLRNNRVEVWLSRR